MVFGPAFMEDLAWWIRQDARVTSRLVQLIMHIAPRPVRLNRQARTLRYRGADWWSRGSPRSIDSCIAFSRVASSSLAPATTTTADLPAPPAAPPPLAPPRPPSGAAPRADRWEPPAASPPRRPPSPRARVRTAPPPRCPALPIFDHPRPPLPRQVQQQDVLRHRFSLCGPILTPVPCPLSPVT